MVRFRGYINDNYIEFEGDADKFLEIVDSLSEYTVETIYNYDDDYDDNNIWDDFRY